MADQPPTLPEYLMDHAPQIFTLLGASMLLLAAYIQGADRLACSRAAGRVDCDLRLDRWFGLITEEHRRIDDVVSTEIRTSSTSRNVGPVSNNSTDDLVTVNSSLFLLTRKGEEVPTLGGEVTSDAHTQVDVLLKGAGDPKIAIVDPMWRVASACAGLGFVIFLFGAFAWRAAIRT